MKIHDNKEIQTYDTRAEAQAVVDALDSTTYELRHGEHSRPDYTARKVRGENRYYIHARYKYYAGTFYARQSGALSCDSNELYNR